MTHPLEALSGNLLHAPAADGLDRYSFTGDVLSFSRCSRQYGQFKHFGFAKALPIQAWFGDVVHMTIEALFRQFSGERPNARGEVNTGELPTDEDVESHAVAAMRILSLHGMHGKPDDKDHVTNLLKTFNHHEGIEFYDRIEQSEVHLETVIRPDSQRAYVLHGVVDMLGADEEGSIEIWDYKAMDRPADDDPKLRSLEHQMFTYAEIVRSLHPERAVKSAVLYFVNELSKEPSGDPVHRMDLESDEAAARIEEARAEAEGIIAQIRTAREANRFPTPARGEVDRKTCDACEWRWSCTGAFREYRMTAP